MPDFKNTSGLERVRAVLENPVTVSLRDNEAPPRRTGVCGETVGREVKLSDMSRLSQTSDMSVLSAPSTSSYINLDWTAEQVHLFEERAALLEYDGEMERSVAEYHARRIVDQKR